MKHILIPLEFELAAKKIVEAQFPTVRFKLSPVLEEKQPYKPAQDAILFEAYFKNSLIEADPLHQVNRYCGFDFLLIPGKRLIELIGWWRDEQLHFIHAPLDPEPYNKHWQNDKSFAISRPYPDGNKFEAMAVDLFPLVQEYLMVK